MSATNFQRLLALLAEANVEAAGRPKDLLVIALPSAHAAANPSSFNTPCLAATG